MFTRWRRKGWNKTNGDGHVEVRDGMVRGKCRGNNRCRNGRKEETSTKRDIRGQQKKRKQENIRVWKLKEADSGLVERLKHEHFLSNINLCDTETELNLNSYISSVLLIWHFKTPLCHREEAWCIHTYLFMQTHTHFTSVTHILYKPMITNTKYKLLNIKSGHTCLRSSSLERVFWFSRLCRWACTGVTQMYLHI